VELTGVSVEDPLSDAAGQRMHPSAKKASRTVLTASATLILANPTASSVAKLVSVSISASPRSRRRM
jgi:hypothetical protein